VKRIKKAGTVEDLIRRARRLSPDASPLPAVRYLNSECGALRFASVVIKRRAAE